MMRTSSTLFVACLLTLSTLPLASAASRDDQAKACRGDAMHFCAADIPDKEKITACMKQHLDELSPGCRAMFKDGKKQSDSSNSQ